MYTLTSLIILFTAVSSFADPKCEKFLDSKDVANAFGIPMEKLNATQAMDTCVFATPSLKNIVISAKPGRDWEEDKKSTAWTTLCPKNRAIAGVGAGAINCGDHFLFLTKSKKYKVRIGYPAWTKGAQTSEQVKLKVWISLAKKLDENFGKMKIEDVIYDVLKPDRNIINEADALNAKMKESGMIRPNSNGASSPKLEGFHPDIKVYPAQQIMPHGESSYQNEKSFNFLLVGPNSREIENFYKSDLKKKGWRLAETLPSNGGALGWIFEKDNYLVEVVWVGGLLSLKQTKPK